MESTQSEKLVGAMRHCLGSTLLGCRNLEVQKTKLCSRSHRSRPLRPHNLDAISGRHSACCECTVHFQRSQSQRNRRHHPVSFEIQTVQTESSWNEWSAWIILLLMQAQLCGKRVCYFQSVLDSREMSLKLLIILVIPPITSRPKCRTRSNQLQLGTGACND